MKFMFSMLVTGFLLVVRPVWAQDVRTEQVRFEPGATSAVVEGSITGYETLDYLLRVRKGQYLNVSMTTDNGANYFNILAPGQDPVAMFNGSVDENRYEGTLPESGNYKIRVYLMRAAARRSEIANYRLEMIVTGPQTQQPAQQAEDEVDSNAARRAGEGDFDARGRIPCAQYKGQPMRQCDFGVARAGGGSATVVVTRPDGSTRALFFSKGEFLSADTAEADGYPEYRSEKESDLHMIRVGDERYEIPDAVIWGG